MKPEDAPTSDVGDDEIAGGSRIPAPIRRNAPLLVGILVVLAAGPAISRTLDAYRAVVLAQDKGGTLVAFESRPPKTIAAVGAQLGDILVKERLQWSPVVVPAESKDTKLLELHRRYNGSYEGVILQIDRPRTATAPYVALVQLQSGERLSVPLYGDHLTAAQQGQRLRKLPGAWEPSLLTEFYAVQPAPAAAPIATPPDTAPPGAAPAPAAPSPAPAAPPAGAAPSPAAPPAQ